jgi:hypothetical protein
MSISAMEWVAGLSSAECFVWITSCSPSISDNFRFAPMSGHHQAPTPRPKSANCGNYGWQETMHCIVGCPITCGSNEV